MSILLVDDDPDLRHVLERVLRRDGFEVVAFDNAATALAKMATLPQPLDLIITDMEMPQVNGLEFFERIKSFFPLPPVMITARGHSTLRTVALQRGVASYLRKPFPMETLLSAVRHALEEADANPNLCAVP